jgi:ribosomal protein S13
MPLGVKDVQEYKTHYDSLTMLIESITNSKYNNRSKVKSNIVLLDMICCYRGWRHFKGLPVRGQRT